MPVYFRESDLARQEALTRENLGQYLPTKEDLRKNAMSQSDAVLGEASGVGSLFEVPIIKKRIKDSILLNKQDPNWYLKPGEKLNPSMIVRAPAEFAVGALKGVADIIHGIISPTFTQENRMRQLDGLMRQWANTQNYMERDDLAQQIKDLEPLAFSKLASWTGNLVQTAALVFGGAGLKEGTKILEGGLKGIGSLADAQKAAQIVLGTQIAAQGAGFVLNNAAESASKDPVGEKIAKGIYQFATDPFGAMIVGGAAIGLFRAHANVGGKYIPRDEINNISHEAKDRENAIREFSKDEIPIKEDTGEVPQEISAQIEKERGLILNNEKYSKLKNNANKNATLADTVAKIDDAIENAKTPQEVQLIRKIIDENSDDLLKYGGDISEANIAEMKLKKKYTDNFSDFIIDTKTKSAGDILGKILDGVKKEIKDTSKWVPRDMQEEAVGVMNDRLKEVNATIKGLYDEYSNNPDKSKIELIKTLGQIKNDITAYITVKNNKTLEEIFSPLNDEGAKMVAEVVNDAERDLKAKTEDKTPVTQDEKTRLKNIGYDDREINEMPRETIDNILEGSSELEAGIGENIRAKAIENARNKGNKAGLGLGIRDSFRDYLSEIERLWDIRVNKIKILPKRVQRLIKKAIANDIKKVALGKATEADIMRNIPNMIDSFLENKIKLWGFDKDTWTNIANAMENKTISSDELNNVIDVLAKHKLLAEPLIKQAGKGELPSVFRVINALKRNVIDGEDGWINMAPRLRNAKMRAMIEDTTETFRDDLKKEINGMFDNLDNQFKSEQKAYSEKLLDEAKNKYEISWGKSIDDMRKYRLDKREDLMSLISQIMKLKKSSKDPLEITLRTYLKGPIESVRNSSETLIKNWTKTQGEVLESLGLGIIEKIQRGIEYHFGAKKKAHLAQIKKLNKQIKQWRKSGHSKYGKMGISAEKIWNWLDEKEAGEPPVELNAVEQRIARQLRGITDYYKPLKRIFPEFGAIRDYIRHDVLGMYQTTDMILRTAMDESWAKGNEEAISGYTKARMQRAEAERAHLPTEALKKAEKEAKKKYDFYRGTVNTFKDGIAGVLEKSYKKNIIKEHTYKTAIEELEKGDGVIQPEYENLIEALQSSPETPYWVRNRIAAGLKASRDMANTYAKEILEEGNFDMAKYKNLEPMAILYQVLLNIKSLRRGGNFSNIPKFFEKDKLVGWVKDLDFISKERADEIINKIVQYDNFQKSFEIVALGESRVLDPSIIKRIPNNLAYKAGDITGQMLNYVLMSHRGLMWGPIAKIFNTIKPEIREIGGKNNAKIKTFLENLFTDVMGRETKFDETMKSLITQDIIPAGSRLFAKYMARKKGVRNPEVYKVGKTLYLKGDVFDAQTQTLVRGVEGIPVESILPSKIGSKLIGTLKMMNYWATLGLSARSGLVNLTQPLLALSKEQETIAGIIPKYKSILNAATAYGTAISKLFTYKGREKLRRAGVLDEVNRMAMEGMITPEDPLAKAGRFNSLLMSIMTGTEHVNRTALYEYFKIAQKDSLKAAGFNSKMIDSIAKDWSDKYNFKFDSLSQPQGLRTEFGKIVFHLGTFAYHQARLLGDELGNITKQLPAWKRTYSSAFSKLGKGDMKGFFKGFDQMNNNERIGIIRWMAATYALTQGMNMLLGFSLNSVYANRTVDFYLTDGPFPELIKDLHGIIIGDNPKEKLKSASRLLIPGGAQLRRLHNWVKKSDWRYFLASSSEIRGEDIHK